MFEGHSISCLGEKDGNMTLASWAKESQAKVKDIQAKGAARSAARTERFAGVKLDPGAGEISYKKDRGPIAGAHANVDSAGEIDKRFTVTRMALAGPLALAFRKKKDNRELYLTVEGNGFAFVVVVDPKDGLAARKFAARINALTTAP